MVTGMRRAFTIQLSGVRPRELLELRCVLLLELTEDIPRVGNEGDVITITCNPGKEWPDITDGLGWMLNQRASERYWQWHNIATSEPVGLEYTSAAIAKRNVHRAVESGFTRWLEGRTNAESIHHSA